MNDTARTNAIAHRGYNESAYIAEMTGLARQLERELADVISERDALRKTADKLDDDKEANARLCESLERELAAERALSYEMASQLQHASFTHDPRGCQKMFEAWKEARTPVGYDPPPTDP